MKRHLTKEEIKDISSFIKVNPRIPQTIAKDLERREKRELKTELKKVVIYPELIPKLKTMLYEKYLNSKVQPGESVGILAGQSIGERQTQSNLNTFHKAGSGDGRPQSSGINELLNATKEPKNPICFVYFIEGNSTISELRNTIGNNLVQIDMKKIVTEYDICIDKKEEIWYPIYRIMDTENEFSDEWTDCISMKINMEILFMYKITLREIAETLNSDYQDIFCVYSPDCFGQLDIYVNTVEMELPDGHSHITAENSKEIYLDDHVRPEILSVIIKGIAGIENMYFVRDGTKWGVELELSETKLPKSVLRYKDILSQPKVDMSRTISYNVWDIYETLGIEAARQYMINICKELMDGIKDCHPTLLIDKMTHAGKISSITRYTMKKEKCGPLSKASFEETFDNLLNAAFYTKTDHTQGVSAAIICGKISNIGTGMNKLKLNLKMFCDK